MRLISFAIIALILCSFSYRTSYIEGKNNTEDNILIIGEISNEGN